MALVLPQLLHEILLYHPFSLILLLFFSIFFLLRFLLASPKNSIKLPPSPPKLPFIGNLHQVSTLAHRSFHDLSVKYGPLMLLYLGHVPTLVVSSAEMASEIMKNQDMVFANRPDTTAARILLYKYRNISFSPYGEYWRKVRKICIMELLSIKRVQNFKLVREEEVALMIEKTSRSCSMGAPINVSEMVLTLSIDIVSRCALGRKYETEGNKKKFGELSREVMKLLGAFSFGDFFPTLGWMDTLSGLVRRLKRVSKELDTFFDQVIEEHLIQRKHEDQDSKKDFVDLLLRVQKDNTLDINLTGDNIKAIILDMFVAGSDTSSTTIEWAMAELVKNPNAMKKSQEEVRRVVGKKLKVEENDINQMDYLKCVIKETLRLHAPAPTLIPRESCKSTNVKGYHIPAKTKVSINAWAIHRDPKLWDNPNMFIPERFSSNAIDFKGQDFELIPFGAGRRGCPGMSFGITVVELAVANLLYWFDWDLPNGANKEELDMTEVSGMVVNKKSPLLLVPTIHFY